MARKKDIFDSSEMSLMSAGPSKTLFPQLSNIEQRGTGNGRILSSDVFGRNTGRPQKRLDLRISGG
jgi:hypothetical protein